MNEAHQRLVEVIKLIETHYGRDMITPNLHLSLHLCECAHDFGPLYAFWYFSFERVNSMLVGSLLETDEFSLDEMRRYLLYLQDIRQSPITGQEPFPGEMLRPSTENIVLSDDMLDRMVEYYNATYEMYNFRKPFGEGPEGSIVINVKMNKFGRCRIGSEIFGSSMSSRHVNSSFILAKFVTSDGEVDCYPGQIQYFFKHTINLQNQSAEHFLAYVRWYQHVASSDVRYYFSSDDEHETCTVKLWRSKFYHESRDCIILVHHILGQFIPVKYKISDRRNAVEYLAINPINRKYHIK
ncbi:hypothetical protein RirG_139790 [Rhizophagus irregularis DAOM 197198w]|uniref:Transposase domain-containing protein n=1 Tax=Rhizophagus irregularis (strain DAOM 197198w) TaxID=1432141 RepID=A0A015KBD8_RHIIW|nr:hypothetical protein RirG_139790 [Rhizophagus irregularis DAOM 197198w]